MDLSQVQNIGFVVREESLEEDLRRQGYEMLCFINVHIRPAIEEALENCPQLSLQDLKIFVGFRVFILGVKEALKMGSKLRGAIENTIRSHN